VVEEYATDEAPARRIEWEAALDTGDVRITLRWNNTADLDLHAIDPNKEEIYYDYPRSESGGQLDHDANYPCEGAKAILHSTPLRPGASALSSSSSLLPAGP
jgi:uncharacterized protein YfaP (DUF2135 family)